MIELIDGQAYRDLRISCSNKPQLSKLNNIRGNIEWIDTTNNSVTPEKWNYCGKIKIIGNNSSR